MEMAHAAIIELLAHFSRDGGGNKLARLRLIIQPFEQPVHPRWNRGTALGGEFSRLRDIGNRKDAGHDLGLNAGRSGAVAEAQEGVAREKNCVMARSAPASIFAFR